MFPCSGGDTSQLAGRHDDFSMTPFEHDVAMFRTNPRSHSGSHECPSGMSDGQLPIRPFVGAVIVHDLGSHRATCVRLPATQDMAPTSS